MLVLSLQCGNLLFCQYSNTKLQGEHEPSGKPTLCVQVQVRLQRPTVVAEIGFMLSVTKFFVPGVTMSGVTPTPFESNDVVLEGMCANPDVPEAYSLLLAGNYTNVFSGSVQHLARMPALHRHDISIRWHSCHI